MAETNGKSRLLNALMGVASTVGVMAFIALLSLWANFQVEQARLAFVISEVRQLREQVRTLEHTVQTLLGR